MKRNHALYFRLPPLLLALVVLRALVPAGYMPASIGGGLIFEMCHEAVPAAVLAAISGGGSHHHHGSHGDATGEQSEVCSLGHILSQAFLESEVLLETPAPGLATPDYPVLIYHLSLAPRYRQVPRGPPAV